MYRNEIIFKGSAASTDGIIHDMEGSVSWCEWRESVDHYCPLHIVQGCILLQPGGSTISGDLPCALQKKKSFIHVSLPFET